MTHGRAVFNAIFDISREINICDYYSQAGSMCFNVILLKNIFLNSKIYLRKSYNVQTIYNFVDFCLGS